MCNRLYTITGYRTSYVVLFSFAEHFALVRLLACLLTKSLCVSFMLVCELGKPHFQKEANRKDVLMVSIKFCHFHSLVLFSCAPLSVSLSPFSLFHFHSLTLTLFPHSHYLFVVRCAAIVFCCCRC